mmetsp:Transcript_106574/g.244001  ORF Transcript_106574/g.244001 Transcript_106574/m.244001 type:complete len:272 (-) Transcript_106574:589-1404(-)
MGLEHRMHNIQVLFLPCLPLDGFPSFLTASMFDGLRSLLGSRLIDVPEYTYAYDDSEDTDDIRNQRRAEIWGQGFTLGFRQPKIEVNREAIRARIARREFDLIVFARISPYEPCNYVDSYFEGSRGTVPMFYADVVQHYPPWQVALLLGDDSGTEDANIRVHLRRVGSMQRGVGIAFVRELNEFVGIDHADQLLPMDEALVQPSCFIGPWPRVLEKWRGGHRCGQWGLCGAEVVWHLKLLLPAAVARRCRNGKRLLMPGAFLAFAALCSRT